jgi:hypothetical protein
MPSSIAFLLVFVMGVCGFLNGASFLQIQYPQQ